MTGKTTDDLKGLAIDPGGWQPYLDDGEVLLWQGQPSARVAFDLGLATVLPSIFGVLFASAAIVIAFQALMAGEPLALVFALPFFAVGAFLAIGRFYWDAYRRSKTRYALTNRRALVARSHRGRSIQSYPIRSDAPIELYQGREDTVSFGGMLRTDRQGRPYPTRHAFERIKNGAHVARLLRQVQLDAGVTPGLGG